MKKVQQRNIL